jgi:hypothetical protein
MQTLTGRDLDVRPYQPEIGDLCGRCGTAKFPIVANHHYVTGWIINLCEGCLTRKERNALNDALDDGLYRSGLR